MVLLRLRFLLLASCAVLELQGSAFAQQWGINNPATMTTFAPTDTVTGSGMAPGEGLDAEFAFQQQDVNGVWHKWGADPVTSVSQTVGGVQVFSWSQTLDPDQEQIIIHSWPLSRVVDGVRIYDYKATISVTGFEASITNLKVDD
jgi:hypothetical protein